MTKIPPEDNNVSFNRFGPNVSVLSHCKNLERKWVELKCINWVNGTTVPQELYKKVKNKPDVQFVCIYNPQKAFMDDYLDENGKYIETPEFKEFKKKYIIEPRALVLYKELRYCSKNPEHKNGSKSLLRYIQWGNRYKKRLKLENVYLVYNWIDYYGKQKKDKLRLIII